MSISIAVAGKGGSGKTSLSAIIVRYLLKKGDGPVLAVDADPNANFGDSLGLKVERTVGSIIASFSDEKINIPPGMTKEAYLEVKVNEAIVESKGLDLVTMGRGEGPECYCYPNLMLRKFIDGFSKSYAYTVMDNEAGMEHMSRRTTQNIDELLFVSDYSIKGIRTIARLIELVNELRLVVKRQSVIINYVPDGLEPAFSEEMDRLGIKPALLIPLDDDIHKYDLTMKPLLDLPDTSKAVTVVNDLLNKLLGKG